MIENQKVLRYISNMLGELNDKYNFLDRIQDKNEFRESLFNYINKNEQIISNYIYANNDLAMKRFLLNNFVKPTFFADENNEPSVVVNQIIIEEQSKPNSKGRPKGSKNKPKEKIVSVPIHSVYDQTFIDAIKDILWYRSGITAKTILQYLECDESIVSLIYGKISQYTNVYWEERKIKNRYGKIIILYYPIEDRKGYFYNGKLYSITKLADEVGMSKVTLWKRIKSGMNHIDAINKPIEINKSTNGKNTRIV